MISARQGAYSAGKLVATIKPTGLCMALRRMRNGPAFKLRSTLLSPHSQISDNPAFTNAAHTEHVSSKLGFLSTFRVRGGFAWDRLYVYATGGFAVGHIESETNISFATFPVNPVYNGAIHIGSIARYRTGWVAGGGAEYGFLPNWSLKVEYLYIDLGSYSYLSPLVAAAPAVTAGYAWSTSDHGREQLIRVGLNYKFVGDGTAAQ